MKIYLDSCIAIYLVENISNSTHVHNQLLYLGGYSVVLASSPLALMECLVKPVKQGQPALIQAYKRFFAGLLFIPSKRKVFEIAAEIRAKTGLKTPDSLHLAYANAGKCDVFLTNDYAIQHKWSSMAVSYQYPQKIIIV